MCAFAMPKIKLKALFSHCAIFIVSPPININRSMRGRTTLLGHSTGDWSKGDYVSAKINTRICMGLMDVFLALSLYLATAWPCSLDSSICALWKAKDCACIGNGVLEEQARKQGLLAM